MARLLAIAIVLVFGCGRPGTDKDYRYTEDSEFDRYIDIFEIESRHRRPTDVNNFEMKFGDLKDNRVGECHYTPGDTKFIYIDEKYWAGASSTARESLINHELGHCFLVRGHKTDTLGGVPVSLMYPNTITGYYGQHREEYLDELFSIYGDWEGVSLTDTTATWRCH